MRRNNGDNTNPDILGDGSNIPGFTDGTPDTFDALQQLNSNAAEINAKFMNDAQEAIKVSAIEGNGAPGPAPGDPSDDRFELSSAVNRAADIYAGTASFVPRGLRFTTGGATLLVTLSSGVFVQAGKKYHATTLKLGAFTVQVGGVDAGNGTSFTLLASRDHYVSIAVDTAEDTVQIQVRDVANGAGPPAVPAGTFVFAFLATDGSGVTTERYPARGSVIQTDGSLGVHGFIVRSADFPSAVDTSLIPLSNDHNIGARTTEELPDESDFGRFIDVVYVQRIETRSYRSAGRESDRSTRYNATATTSGAATSDIPVEDLDDFPNSSVIEVKATAVAYTDLNQAFAQTIQGMAEKTSAGAMGLVGATTTIRLDDPGAIAATVTLNFSGANQIRVRLTGAVGHDMTWVVTIETTQMRGI